MINILKNTVIVFALISFSQVVFSQESPVPATFNLGSIHFEEGFESGIPAGWTNLALDQAKNNSVNNGWVIDQDTTHSSAIGTGPTGAQEGSFYAYCDGSSPIGRGTIATMTSPVFSLADADEPALLFYLNMHGRSGSFHVNVVDGATAAQVLPSVIGDVPGGIHASDVWEEIFIDLSAYTGKSIQLEFVTIKPNIPNTGDIAIDNIRVGSVMTTVPTMGQWGLISLLLILLIVGVTAQKQETVVYHLR